jgi:hypothetical protein
MKSTSSKSKPAPVAVIPVSERANLDLTLYDEPQGKQRGVLIASDVINGKFVRLAHTYLMTDTPSIITLDRNGRRHTAAEMERNLAILALFVSKVKALDAER